MDEAACFRCRNVRMTLLDSNSFVWPYKYRSTMSTVLSLTAGCRSRTLMMRARCSRSAWCIARLRDGCERVAGICAADRSTLCMRSGMSQTTQSLRARSRICDASRLGTSAQSAMLYFISIICASSYRRAFPLKSMTRRPSERTRCNLPTPR
eukprot:973369-Prymnesium_polylepis.2